MGEPSSISILWYSLIRHEFLFPVVLAAAIAAIAGRPLDWVAGRVGKWLSSLGRRPILSALTAFFLVITIRFCLLPWVPVPVPIVHDEFSQLLLSDTFAHGRLTNPPSPMWVHFETFHVNMLPTYQSMYQPGQGIFLALGQVLFGSPYAGVMISVGLMCAAYVWAFRGWLPPRWAMFGALLTVLRYCSTDYWMNSYWGGAVAAAGGALVLGAYGRLRRPRNETTPLKPKEGLNGAPVVGIFLALGLLLLANTRPYEGLIYSIPLGIGVLLWVYRRIREKALPVRNFVFPLVAVLVVGFSVMMFYFWRSTGNPLRMPYTINQEQYHPTRPFVWQSLREVHYNHPVMQKVYTEWEMGFYKRTRTISGIASYGWERVRSYLDLYLYALVFPFLVGLLFALRKARLRIVVASVALMFFGMTLVMWQGLLHYSAPAACALLLISLVGLRVISTSLRHKKRFGLRFARAYILVYAVMLFFLQLPAIEGASHPGYSWGAQRAAMVRDFDDKPGQHLILVRYRSDHNQFQEWVYNGYDLENGKVLWAREMADPAQNRELIAHYPSRRVWLVDADRFRATAVPYPDVKP
jgi:hypothetical protein